MMNLYLKNIIKRSVLYIKNVIGQQRFYTDTQKNHFEVERKFKFDPSKVNLLEANRGKKPFDKVMFLSEKSFTDIYYDNLLDYPLTTNDIWLRQRDDKWECKTPVNLTASMDSYHELENTTLIKNFLDEKLKNNQAIKRQSENIPYYENKSFKEFLFKNYKLEPFCTITTQRRSYLINNKFTMVLDTADFGHSVGEIELIVESTDKVQDAEKRIAMFMKEHDWFFETEGVVMGKLMAYISRFNQNQWECMEKSNVVKRKLFPETLENIVTKT
ncbi:CYTH-like domain-containing protein [Glomus cerebriforme]|uniref:CYTH-like domain-containing protein n=1 Tax=Glomus cerebriforme TaxID=658196 RepID=A0A397SNB9_9GLOM|nr:CYTH-like domain-containing protein [Glomus cerebriforme]